MTQDHDLLLVAEKLGSALDRLERIETELQTQALPIQGAAAAQASALTALEAALAGVKALNQHVLGNDLGALSARVEEAGKQVEAEITRIDHALSQTADKIEAKIEATRAELAAATATRHELSAEREAGEAKLADARKEFSASLASLRSEFADAVKKFATPQSVNPRGEWIDGETYARLDLVSVSGSSYISTIDNNRSKPRSGAAGWQLVAKRGAGGGGGGMVSDGTTTEKGIVRLATATETIAGTSSSIANTPAGLIEALFNANFIDLTGTTSLTQVTSGTTTGGSSSQGPVHFGLTAPTTAVGGFGLRVASNVGFGWRRGEIITSSTGFNYSSDLRIDARINIQAVDANATWRLSFGKNFASSIGNLAARGFGIRRVGTGVLELIVHNGTTSAAVSTTITPTTGLTFDVSLRFNGTTGGCDLFVNDSLAASSQSGVGTGAGSLNTPTLWMELENTSTATTQSILGVFRPKMLFGA